MRTVALTCSLCQKTFERSLGEHNRNQKIGRKTLCGRHCTGVSNAAHLPPDTGQLIPYYGKRTTDELSPFRWHLRNARRRAKERGTVVEIALRDLKILWENQSGVCPYTGVVMKNMACHADRLALTPDRASLDRIDSTRGYVRGNVQFVSYMAQCAKNSFTEQQLLNFCKKVVEHGSRTEERASGDHF